MQSTEWHGTSTELRLLVACLNRNCACERDSGTLCAHHRALRFEQAFLDRLVFVRRIRERFVCEEWLVEEVADSER
jgi:hypothetical protein